MIWLFAIGLFLLSNLLFFFRISPITISTRMALMIFEMLKSLGNIKTLFYLLKKKSGWPYES